MAMNIRDGAERRARAAERVLVLDFGSQYAQLIARRVREQNVFCQIVRHDLTAERDPRARPRGPDPLRRPGERLQPRAPKCDPEVFDLGIPVLGICYGMQLACQALGGKVEAARQPRVRPGHAATSRDADDLFAGVPDRDRPSG